MEQISTPKVLYIPGTGVGTGNPWANSTKPLPSKNLQSECMEPAYCLCSQNHRLPIKYMSSKILIEKTGIKDSQHPLPCTSHDLNQHLPALFVRMAVFSSPKQTVWFISKENVRGIYPENVNEASQAQGANHDDNQVSHHTWEQNTLSDLSGFRKPTFPATMR